MLTAGLISSGFLLLLLNEFHEEIAEPWLRNIDQGAMRVVHSWYTPEMTRVMLTFTFMGSWEFIASCVGLLIFALLYGRRTREAASLAVAVGGSAVLNVGLKLWFHRLRPEVPWVLVHESSFSFPSGHAVVAFCFYATITLLLARRGRVATRAISTVSAIFIILGIGTSRVYLGVHYPSDIAAGYLVGIVWVAATLVAARYCDSTTQLRGR
jgi:undecaprenyl-diphosphatase